MSHRAKTVRAVSRALSSAALRREALDAAGDPFARMPTPPWGCESDACSVRRSTAAVARRLAVQEEAALVPGTPHTLSGALAPSDQARVVTDLRGELVYANRAWEELCGYKLEEVKGTMGLKFLQGPLTEKDKVLKINKCVREQQRVNLKLHNYQKNGELFFNQIQVSPLTGSSGRVTHLLGILEKVE
ncbi:unnamed protein product [Ostreobium quekettii]|uniref:PAS domain-containing protein n=1 Tax=Ostreobium quekettii TaxID=121088 RepID=A0A8S1IVS4_9CHLO|nr:unnamed protein product [Ostreobium quekettii]|eukprot:evm.model.scf_102.8 EVM.evm.TU.scf_102.8   scf_102:124945-126270(-)